MNPYCMPGFSLHDELALLVESGLTPLAALQSATLRPAEFLGRTADLGSVAPGKLADLVLLGADPLADIHNTTQIQAVWFHGKYFDHAALDGLLEAAKHRSGKGKLH
jgi:imidazolonepropionase-like amidohydrolase